ncbi:hypothetical protein [Paenibacillus lutrae]|uniref:Uncharacterized protein n=1 Tax=Paenibacillus lutrae TaxID=2078573 RepID=A0A7X3FFP2_9BACL|nr:hypothetical protein [Paenibacillus lutrae]MVO98827.1 hypothetical protein [Paenibacillus lutrae]
MRTAAQLLILHLDRLAAEVRGTFTPDKLEGIDDWFRLEAYEAAEKASLLPAPYNERILKHFHLLRQKERPLQAMACFIRDGMDEIYDILHDYYIEHNEIDHNELEHNE